MEQCSVVQNSNTPQIFVFFSKLYSNNTSPHHKIHTDDATLAKNILNSRISHFVRKILRKNADAKLIVNRDDEMTAARERKYELDESDYKPGLPIEGCWNTPQGLLSRSCKIVVPPQGVSMVWLAGLSHQVRAYLNLSIPVCSFDSKRRIYKHLNSIIVYEYV